MCNLIFFSNLEGFSLSSINQKGGGAQYLKNNQRPIIEKVRELNEDLFSIGGIK